MAKTATLDDLTKLLKEQNKKQDDTNNNLDELIKIMKKDAEFNRRKAAEDKSGLKFGGKGDKKNPDWSNTDFAGSLLRGDFLTAIIGSAAGTVLLIIGAITALFKFSETIQEFFQPLDMDLKKKSQEFRNWLAAGWQFSTIIETIFGWISKFSKMTYGLLGKMPFFGASLNGFLSSVGKIAIAVDNYIKRFARISPSSFLGIFAGMETMFRRILKIDVAIKGFVAGFKAFEGKDGPFGLRLIYAIVAGITEAAGYFITSFVEAIPLTLKALSFVFDNALGWIENLNIPVISDIAGFFRNIFLWLEELVTSNEDFNNWLASIGNFWEAFKEIGANFKGVLLATVDKLWLDISKILDSELFGKVTDWVNTHITPRFEPLLKLLDQLGDWVNGLISKFTKFKVPDRWPWEKSEEQKTKDQAKKDKTVQSAPKKAPEERMQKQETKRVEEITAAKEAKDKAQRQTSVAPVIVTSAPVSSNTTNVSSQTNIHPIMRPDGYNPASIPEVVY